MIATIDGLPSGSGPATGRGTAGLIAAVQALGLVGRRVLVPANLCGIAVEGLLAAGARPVLHDVSPETGAATPDLIAEAWDADMGAVVAVHGVSVPLDMAAIMDWARDRRLPVIEDVCLALGATCGGVPAGALGDAAFYSFGGGKTADAGVGGAVTARDPEAAVRLAGIVEEMPELAQADRDAVAAMEAALRGLRVAGAPEADHRAPYRACRPHMARRLHAGGAQRVASVLADLPGNVAHRRAMACAWAVALAGADVRPADLPEGAAPWRFNILVDPTRRDAVVGALRGAGHGASTWYPPVDSIFGEAVEVAGPLTGARHFADRVVNLWVDAATTPDRVAEGAALIRQTLEAPA